MEKRFQKRIEGFKKKARQLSTLCDVEICLVVFGRGSQTPTAVWPDGDQIWKAETICRRYLTLPPKQPPSQTSSGIVKRGGECDDQEVLHDRLGGFSEEGLRDLARVLEGKLEEAKRKMEAGCMPRGRRPGQSLERKRAKVGESGLRITITPATPGAVDSRCNGMTNGGSDVNAGCVLDDQKKLVLQDDGCSLPESERSLALERAEACDTGARGMVSCPFPACMEYSCKVANLASWRWPDNSSIMEMIMREDNESDTQEMEALWIQD